MKSWFIFGFGLVVGVMFGAFLAAFLLFDDLTEKRPHRIPTVMTATKAPLQKTKVLAILSIKKAEPVVIAAEAVAMDSLPNAEENDALATAKREDAAIPSQSAP